MSLQNVCVKKEYRSLIDNIVKDFYIPLLNEAVEYKRAVGFFSSSVLAEISKGISRLVRNGGKIKIVASPYLSEEDIQAIKAGYEMRDDIIKSAIRREMHEASNEFEAQRLNLLANLIAQGVLDIKIAFTENKEKMGMYHEKMGIISDLEGNMVAFSGSMNESATALTINYETIDVYCSWDNEQDRVLSKLNAFTSIWNDTEPNIHIIDFPELDDEIIQKYKTSAPNYDIDKCEFGEEIISEVNPVNTSEINGPCIPKGFSFHDYQIEAISNWAEKGYCGIFDMATGTGKTYTGLGAITKLSETLDYKLAVVIVCPYQHLVEQWVEDIVKFNINPIIGYSASSQKDWKKRLENAVRDQKLHVSGKEFFCFICTNATYSSEFVQVQLSKIKANSLFVVDEAHNFGAKYLSDLLNEKFKYRLALSATLDRHNDPEGTEKLYNYFGEKCIEYSLERAIHEGKLTKYKYYPIIVSLTDDERDSFQKLSKEIQRCLSKQSDGSMKLNERGKKLALKRARLVAAAENKIYELERVILPYINNNHLLVYCGSASIHDFSNDNSEVSDDDLRQIDAVTDLLGNKLGMTVSQFTSKEDIYEREILKREFDKGDTLQALIAIKCLDEGVNIPSIKTAFILASTTNPKEYIQRRGRVLRLYPGKEFAEIYDFITLPRELDNVYSMTDESKSMELSLVRNELSRAFEFARLADNFVEANIILDEIREAYNLHDESYEFTEDYDIYE